MNNVAIPLKDFTQLKQGETFKSEINLGDFFHQPGVYDLHVKKLYPHDGGNVGLDAWTGVVASSSIRVTVVSEVEETQ